MRLKALKIHRNTQALYNDETLPAAELTPQQRLTIIHTLPKATYNNLNQDDWRALLGATAHDATLTNTSDSVINPGSPAATA